MTKGKDLFGQVIYGNPNQMTIPYFLIEPLEVKS